jgi:hypothetical protein
LKILDVVEHMRRIIKCFGQFFIGSNVELRDDFLPAYSSLVRELKVLWKDSSFGLLRIFRFVLVIVGFLNPITLLIHFVDLAKPILGKLFVDLYVIIKLVITLMLLFSHLQSNLIRNIAVIYFISDTVLSLLGIVFFQKRYDQPISYSRSLLLLILNYFTIVAGFAYFYLNTGSVYKLSTPVEALYFRLVSSTTLGYGDMYPTEDIGYTIVTLQLVTSVLMVTIFFAFFVTRAIDEDRRRGSKK